MASLPSHGDVKHVIKCWQGKARIYRMRFDEHDLYTWINEGQVGPDFDTHDNARAWAREFIT